MSFAFLDNFLTLHIYLYLPLFSDKYNFQRANKHVNMSCGKVFNCEKDGIEKSRYQRELFCVWVTRNDKGGIKFLESIGGSFYNEGLIEAVKYDVPDMVRYMLRRGATTYQKSMQIAIKHGNKDIYELLLQSYLYRSSLYQLMWPNIKL
jgi:hypothetical protein